MFDDDLFEEFLYIKPYIFLAAVLVVGLLLARLLSLLISKYLVRAGSKKSSQDHKKSIRALRPPLQILCVAFCLYVGEHFFPIHSSVREIMSHFMSAIVTATIYLLVYHATGLFLVRRILDLFGFEYSKDFESLLIAVSKSIVAILGVLSVLQSFNINVTAILGGLTIITTGIALAAKDTVQQFIGALSLYLEGRFKIGDWIKTPEVEGIVEFVGIRSTMVRRFDKALVAVPSDHLANASLINFLK